MTVNFINKQRKIKLSRIMKELLKQAVDMCFLQEGFEIDSELNIIFVNNDNIRKLNNKFRSIDAPTDVLSFPLIEMEKGKTTVIEGDIDMDSKRLMLGDIVISTEYALKQSSELGHSFERELAFLVTHGVYHLLGYDHYDEDNEMLKKQEVILKKINLQRMEQI